MAFSGRQVARHTLLLPFAQFGGDDQIGHHLAQHVRAAITECLFGRAIPFKNPPFVIDRHDAVERRFHNGAAPGLVFPLNIFQLLVFPADLSQAKLPLDHWDEARNVVLRNVIRRSCLDGDHRIRLADGPGEDDKRNVGPGLLQDTQCLEASKPRHRVIGQDDVPGP